MVVYNLTIDDLLFTFLSDIVESNLHLCQDGMVGTMDELPSLSVCTLVDILHLEAAFFVEPVLKAGDSLVLIHAQRGVKVEEVVRTYDVESFGYGYVACHVGATAGSTAVLAFQIFAMHIQVCRLVVETNGPTVTLVVVALLDVRIIKRFFDGVTSSYLSCSY